MDPFEANPSEDERSDEDPESGLPVWTLDLDDLDSGPPPPPPPSPTYPDRPDRILCSYYMRTGRCGFGDNCRFHHPRVRSVMNRSQRTGYAEHRTRTICRYFAKNRICNYGDACRFEHPMQDGYEQPTWMSSYGYPPSNQVPSALSTQRRYPVLESSNQSMLPSPYIQGPYGPLLVFPGLLQDTRWSNISATVNPQQTDVRCEVSNGSVLSAHVYPFYPGSSENRAASVQGGSPPFVSESEIPSLPSASAATQPQLSPYPAMDSSARESTNDEGTLPGRLAEPDFQNHDAPGLF